MGRNRGRVLGGFMEFFLIQTGLVLFAAISGWAIAFLAVSKIFR